MEDEFDDADQYYFEKNQQNTSEDDIQDIIIQAQKAFAKRDENLSEQRSENTAKNTESPQHSKGSAQQYVITTNRDGDSLARNKKNGRVISPRPVFSDQQQQTKRTNKDSGQNNSIRDNMQGRSNRNNVINGDGNSDGMYIDTNLEREIKAYEQEQERKITPEPFKQETRNDPENLSSTRKNTNGPNTKRIEHHLIPQRAMDNSVSHASSFEKMTGHFNTKFIKNGQEVIDSDQFNNIESNMGSLTQRENRSSNFVSAAGSLYPSTKRDGMSPMQQYRKRIFNKHPKKSGLNTRVSSCSPDKIDNEFSKHRRNQSTSMTRFSRNFGQLIDKITDIYPEFLKVANSKDLNPHLLPEDLLRAENVYNQLRFLYQKAIEEKQENTLNDENSSALKYKYENAERELTYFQNQINILKNQLQNAAMREQQTEVNYEKRLEFLNQQIRQYEQTVDHLQIKIENLQNEKDSQLSFRDKNEKYKGGLHEATFFQQTPSQKGEKIEMDNKISELNFEIKDLKTKLKFQQESIEFEKDNNHMLMEKIDKMNEAFKKEIGTYQKEGTNYKGQISDKHNQIKTLENKIEELTHLAQLEFPIVISNQSQSLGVRQGQMHPSSTTNAPKFIDMKKRNKSPFLDEIEMDLDDIMNMNNFDNDGEIQLSTLGNLRKPKKGILKTAGNTRNTHQNLMRQTQNYTVQSMFSLSDCFKQQMSSVLISDDILKSMKQSKQEQMQKIESTLTINQKFNEKMEVFQQEKLQMGEKLSELTKDNENLKLKFSQLLDQFQEYVNETERKTEEDQLNNKSEQEKLLGELNNSIKDLNQMNKQLALELEEKQRSIDKLRSERDNLVDQIKEANEQQKVADSTEEVHKVQIKSLNEEIKYMKQQYMLELEGLRNDNVSLHQKIREKSIEANNRRFNNLQRSSSPYDNEEQIQNKYEDSVLVDQQNDYLLENMKLNRNKSQIHMNQMKRSRENRWKDNQDHELQDCLYDANQYRSKSQDRITGGIQDAQDNASKRNFDMQSSVYEEKKREMLDKDRLIEQKNKEIVKLRMENDELRQVHEQQTNNNTRTQSRNQIIDEIEDFLHNIKIELEKTKKNLYSKSDNQQPMNQAPYSEQKAYKSYQNEDSLLTALFDKMQVMHNLMALASEVYILSSQNMYARQNHSFQQQPQAQLGMVKIPEVDYQKLVQENQHLERLIDQYEQTIAKFEFTSQNPDDQKGLIELQRLTQSQLQQISQLQHEMAQMQEELNNQNNFGAQHNQITKLQNENRAYKQENQLLRENELRQQNLQNGNEELLGERKQLLQKIDHFEQIQSQLNLQLQDAQLQVADRDGQLEELRNRITQIAELFEKKPIKQRYSFEVLCDFVNDKAKRLFTKYENALKQKKSLEQDDKNQRKIFKLEAEIASLNDQTNMIKNFAIPMMMNLLSRDYNKDDMKYSNPESFRQLLSDVEYEFKKQQKELSDNSQTIKSNLRQIESLQSALDQLPNENRHPNHYNGGYSPGGGRQINLQYQNDDQLKVMQQEKNELHSKINEFSQVMKEFQANQRQFEMENQQLKSKIEQLEGNNAIKPQDQTDRYSHHVPHSINMQTSLGTPNDQKIQQFNMRESMSGSNNIRRNEQNNYNLISSAAGQNFNQTNFSGKTQNAAPGGYIGGVIQQSPLKHQKV